MSKSTDMSYFVSIETAIRLRDAGFPQPEFKFGQLWETETGRVFAFVGTSQFALLKVHHLKEIVFRPTVEDILSELAKAQKNGKGGIVRVDVSAHNGGTLDSTPWFAVYTVYGNSVPEFYDNFSEGAAIKWLEIHDKK